MKAPEKPNGDEPLSRILREWEVKSPLPLGFEAAVFKRIERSERRSSRTFWLTLEYWISTLFGRPAIVTVLFAAFISVGLTAGWRGGQQEAARTKAELSQRYLRMVSPQPAAHTEMK